MTLSDKRLEAAVALAALVALGLLIAAGAAPPRADAQNTPNCTEARNIEAIIDDSGSMGSSDPGKLRNALIDTLVGLPVNNGKQMGAVEFATDATVLFSPIPIGDSSAQATVGSFLGLINDDGSQAPDDFGGSTNYNAGFTTGNAANPSADARIFLSDGQPNEGGTPTTYLTPPTKTYVVGFDAATTGGSILGQIAAGTGGSAFAVNTASEILPAAGVISAALNCDDIQTFTAQLNSQGQSRNHKFKATGKSAQILTTWPSALTNLTITVNPVGGNKAGKAVATVSAVKGKRSKGSNFSAIKAKGLKKGRKYRIKVKAKQLSVPTLATTQVIK